MSGSGSAAGGGVPPDAGGGVPPDAEAMFGAVLPAARRYAGLLADAGVQRGIIGPAEADRIWDRHLMNCGVVARLVPARGSLVDLGSGGGLPGVVLALLRPGVRVTLLEPMARRVDFLREVLAEVGIANAEVLRGRAEEMAGQLAADTVAARAVAPLDRLAVLAAGLLRPGGRVLAMKGASAGTELAAARPALARLAVSDAHVVQAANETGRVSATVVTFTVPGMRLRGPSAGAAPGGKQRRGGRPGNATTRRAR